MLFLPSSDLHRKTSQAVCKACRWRRKAPVSLMTWPDTSPPCLPMEETCRSRRLEGWMWQSSPPPWTMGKLILYKSNLILSFDANALFTIRTNCWSQQGWPRKCKRTNMWVCECSWLESNISYVYFILHLDRYKIKNFLVRSNFSSLGSHCTDSPGGSRGWQTSSTASSTFLVADQSSPWCHHWIGPLLKHMEIFDINSEILQDSLCYTYQMILKMQYYVCKIISKIMSSFSVLASC